MQYNNISILIVMHNIAKWETGNILPGVIAVFAVITVSVCIPDTHYIMNIQATC